MKLKITAEENFSAVYPRSTSPRKVHESFHHIHPINSLCSMHPWKKELKATPVLQFYRALPSTEQTRKDAKYPFPCITYPLNKTICNPHDRSNRQKGRLPNTKSSFSETKKTKTPRNPLDWKDFFFLPCNAWQCSVLSWERQGAQRKERNLNLLKVRHDLSLSFSVRERDPFGHFPPATRKTSDACIRHVATGQHRKQGLSWFWISQSKEIWSLNISNYLLIKYHLMDLPRTWSLFTI